MPLVNLTASLRASVAPARLQAASLVLGLLAFWLFTHRYLGIVLDGEIYSVQALSRIHPYLAGDIYLANTSQDSFTVFSPLFAALIRSVGLIAASTALFATCTFIHIASLWALVRRLLGPQIAFFSSVFAICCVLPYGAYHVFTTSEDYLTARSLAEALVACSFAFFAWDRRFFAFALSVLALFVHPLMSLPGLLVLVCMSVSWRTSALGAGVGLLGTVCLSALAAKGMVPLDALKVMNQSWLDVVLERSQFLFLRYWHWSDFALQIKPYLTIAFACLAIKDSRIRHWSYSAVLVGITGLAIAGIAGAIGPIPLLVQGQAWRWTWVTSTVAVCLVAPGAHSAWRAGGIGRICAALLVLAWIFVPVDGNLVVGTAILLWPMRTRVKLPERFVSLSVAGLVAIPVVWSLANAWDLVVPPNANKHTDFNLSAFTNGLFGLQPIAILVAAVWWFVLRRTSTSRLALAIAVTAIVAIRLPVSLINVPGFDLVRDRDEYRDWRDAIPESSSVLLLPSSKTAGFIWITLQRTSYISVSQSAGVVFSPKTAAEIKRRSEVLLPVMAPDWRILSQIRHAATEKSTPDDDQPLTAQGLTEICHDEQLGFVIAKEDLGFAPLRHTHLGPHKGWNLYDCSRIRARGAST